MKNFAELARVVTSTGLKKHDTLFDDSSPNGKKYLNLAKALTGNPDLTDDEAEKITGLKKSSSSFRMFRLRFKEKLLNSFQVTDVELITNYARAISTLARNQFCIRVLILISARSTAIDLTEQTLKKSLEFQIYDVALYCCRILRQHQRLINNLRQYEYYEELYYEIEKLFQAENRSIEIFDKLMLRHGNSQLFKFEGFEYYEPNLIEIRTLKEQYNSYQVTLYFYRFQGTLLHLSQKYQEALMVYNEAVSFLETYKHFEFESRLGEFLMYKMNLFLYLHDYEKGLECADQCATIFKPGTNNWIIYNEILYILALHTKNYSQASRILEQVTGGNHLKFQMQLTKERWRIFEAYYFILLRAGVAERTANIKFRFSTFLNSITIHSKDKKGYNASILIAEMMYHILNKEFHVVTEKMDALKRYSKRHFEDSDNYRSDIFIRILIECEKNKFEKAPVLQKTKKLVDKLQEIQFSYISSLDGIEIVPFIDLWKIVLNCLD